VAEVRSRKFWAWVVFAIGVGYFLLPLVATFIFSMQMRRGRLTFDAYASVFADARFQSTFSYSLACAAFAIVVGVTIVLPAAYFVRLRLQWLRPVMEFITLLPLIVPPIILVFGHIKLFNSSSILPLLGTIQVPFTSIVFQTLGTDILIVCGYVTLALPYMYRAIDTGLRTIDVQTMTEAATILGAGPIRTMVQVILPNIFVAVLSGAFLTFAIAIGEFVLASLLNRPAFGVYMQNIGANRAYEPSALAIISFALTWGAMGVIQLLDRFAPKTARKD
jgi:putative spermidine/putrescine transport system permease protein